MPRTPSLPSLVPKRALKSPLLTQTISPYRHSTPNSTNVPRRFTAFVDAQTRNSRSCRRYTVAQQGTCRCGQHCLRPRLVTGRCRIWICSGRRLQRFNTRHLFVVFHQRGRRRQEATLMLDDNLNLAESSGSLFMREEQPHQKRNQQQHHDDAVINIRRSCLRSRCMSGVYVDVVGRQT